MAMDEVISEMLNKQIETMADSPLCVIDPETRTITVPSEYQLLGVENDKRVERIHFQCPKIVGDNQDLSQGYQLFINYQNANGDPDAYHINDMIVEDDNITFSWLLEENVTKYRGNIQFAFGAIKPGDEAEDPDKNRWNTTINTDCTCLVGLKSTQQVAESNPDTIVQIWAAINELKAGGGGGGGNPSGRGWTSEQVAMLETLGQYLVYTDQTTGQSILDGLISSLRESSGGTTEPGVYTITKELTNVTIDNESTSVTSGSIYAASLTASNGYYIESVTITMGGQNITQSAYSEGKINIGSVTGNIVIIANGTLLDNLIKLSECTSGNESMPDGAIATEGVMLVTPFISVDGSLMYKTNINRNLPETQVFSQKCYMYNSEKSHFKTATMDSNNPYGKISDFVLDSSTKYVRIMFRVENENPYFGLKGIV